MAKDLYSCDLSSLTFTDIEEFVALGIREDVRVDYKGDVPQDLGDPVAAFSNTYGGLLLVGVDDKDGLPSGIPGIARNPKSDLKTRLANKICSGVFPRPSFEIGIVALASDPSRDVAVVRVHEGYETPYMFDGKKVSIRIVDKCGWASLFDLERLFQRRERGPGAFVRTEDRNIDVFVTHPENQTQVHADTWFKFWLWPTQPLTVRLERRVEAAFRTVVSQSFPWLDGIEIDDRHGSWVDLSFRSRTVLDLNARWRLTSNGSIGFVIQPYHSTCNAIPLADLVRDAARFMLCGAVVLQASGWQGRVMAQAVLATIDRRIIPGSADGTHAIDGIVNVGTRTNRGAGDCFATFASPGSIDPAGFISELVMDSLRTERRSEVDYDRLLASVHQIIAAAEPPDVGGGNAPPDAPPIS